MKTFLNINKSTVNKPDFEESWEIDFIYKWGNEGVDPVIASFRRIEANVWKEQKTRSRDQEVILAPNNLLKGTVKSK